MNAPKIGPDSLHIDEFKRLTQAAFGDKVEVVPSASGFFVRLGPLWNGGKERFFNYQDTTDVTVTDWLAQEWSLKPGRAFETLFGQRQRTPRRIYLEERKVWNKPSGQ